MLIELLSSLKKVITNIVVTTINIITRSEVFLQLYASQLNTLYDVSGQKKEHYDDRDGRNEYRYSALTHRGVQDHDDR